MRDVLKLSQEGGGRALARLLARPARFADTGNEYRIVKRKLLIMRLAWRLIMTHGVAIGKYR